jgi:prepilin-type processing-associated H-X9-DG protein
LICVIVVIAVLASMLLPAIGKMTERANNTKCQNNLKQLATAAHSWASDHENVFPVIEFDPENPAYEAQQNALPLNEAFKSYGINAENLKCAADVRGPNWFAKKGYSYMWQPQVAGEETVSVTIFRGRNPVEVPLSRVVLASDFESVHFPDQTGAAKRRNVVYADGHVVAR